MCQSSKTHLKSSGGTEGCAIVPRAGLPGSQMGESLQTLSLSPLLSVITIRFDKHWTSLGRRCAEGQGWAGGRESALGPAGSCMEARSVSTEQGASPVRASLHPVVTVEMKVWARAKHRPGFDPNTLYGPPNWPGISCEHSRVWLKNAESLRLPLLGFGAAPAISQEILLLSAGGSSFSAQETLWCWGSKWFLSRAKPVHWSSSSNPGSVQAVLRADSWCCSWQCGGESSAAPGLN